MSKKRSNPSSQDSYSHPTQNTPLPPSSPPASFSGYNIEGSSLLNINNDNDNVRDEAEEVVDEAEVDNNQYTENENLDSESSGEDLFGSQLENDYNQNPELDRYDSSQIDDNPDILPMSFEQRRRLESQMDIQSSYKTKHMSSQRNKRPSSIQKSNLFSENSNKLNFIMSDDNMDEEIDLESLIRDYQTNKIENMEKILSLDSIKNLISQRFTKFIEEFCLVSNRKTAHNDKTVAQEDNVIETYVYLEKIKRMAEENHSFIEIDYQHLISLDPVLAYLVMNFPSFVLETFNEGAMMKTIEMFEYFKNIHTEVNVRIKNLAIKERVRDLRIEHKNKLVSLSGVISRRSKVYPQLKYAKYRCLKCYCIIGPFYVPPNQVELNKGTAGQENIKIDRCFNCESKGPFVIVNEQTVFRDFQLVTLQETPGSIRSGRLPHSIDVVCMFDLVDRVKPGDEIECIGIYEHLVDFKLNNKHGFPVFSTVLQANNILLKNETNMDLTQDDIQQILKLSKSPEIVQKIIDSIAPSIYGHEYIKTCIALSLFGGCQKVLDSGIHARGDVNILMVGDPGTAKSQFLRYILQTSSRCVYATGQGASGVGLTATVKRDAQTREWTLEGGALVLADKGLCLIDEFDKMNDKDRTSIHEAMEQQTISISKAGIVATLQARCGVIAAANPIRGKYNAALSLNYNVDLTDPILSRFDLVCIVLDRVDATIDHKLATFVLQSHKNSHPYHNQQDKDNIEIISTPKDEESGFIEQELLKKYITYARMKCRPKLSIINKEKIAKVFNELRKESGPLGGHRINMRHLQSITRLSEAFAKMQLLEEVNTQCVELAIQTVLKSFILCQKASSQKYLNRKFAKYLIDRNNVFKQLAQIVLKLVTPTIDMYRLTHTTNSQDSLDIIPSQIKIKMSELENKAKYVGVHNIEPFLKSKAFKDLAVFITKENDTRYIVKDMGQ